LPKAFTFCINPFFQKRTYIRQALQVRFCINFRLKNFDVRKTIRTNIIVGVSLTVSTGCIKARSEWIVIDLGYTIASILANAVDEIIQPASVNLHIR